MRKFLFTCLLFFLLLPVIVSSETYYVDATEGLDSNNGLSPGTAWQTITKVYDSMGLFQPGDQILFQRGETWSDAQLSISRSGNPGNPIIFADYGAGPKPTITGNLDNGIMSSTPIHDVTVRNFHITGSGIVNGIAFYGENNGYKYRISIENCDVDNVENVGIYIDSTDNFTVENCTVSYPGNAGITIYGSDNYKANNGRLINCTAIDDGTASNDGISIHDGGSLYTGPGTNFFLYKCVSHGWKENSFDMAAKGTSNVLLRECEGYNSAIGTGLPTVSYGYAQHIYIEDSYFHDDNAESIYFGSTPESPTTHAVVARTTIVNSEDRYWTVGGTASYMYLAHNTFVYDTASNHRMLDIMEENGDDPQYVFARNNIFTGRKAVPQFMRYLGCDADSVPSDFDYNCWWDYIGNPGNNYWTDASIGGHNLATRRSTYGEDVHSIFQDPRINSNLTLQPDSPCIDNGTWLITITSSSGSGTQFTVQDANWFHDGFGLTTGSEIQLEGDSSPVLITNVDYGTNTITVDQTVTWTQGDGVAFAYSGSRPDMGAFEYQETGDTWYVRPAGGNYGAEDGSSYANAWDGLGNVVWGSGSVETGDTLYICGLHHRTFTGASLWEQIDMNEVSGSQGNLITIRGDCPGDQGIIWGAGVLAHEAWVNEGSNTYSITIPSSMYSGWLFEDVTASSWTVLDKENTLQDCMNNPGSYYSANYQTGTKLYVHTSDNGIPTNRISFPRAGYMFIADNCSYIEWKNLKFYYLYRMFFDWTLDHNVAYMTWDNLTMWYGEGAIQEWRSTNTHHFTVKNSDIAWAQNGLITGPKTGGPSTDCAHDYTFSGNYIHDIGVRVTHPDAHCIGVQGGYNDVIEKNVCVNCGTGPLLYADGSVQSIKDTIIRWNLVKDCHTLGGAGGYGISFMCDGPNTADKSGNQVYGNIVTNCTDAYRYKWEYQTVFYNNIAHNSDKSFRIYRGQADSVAPNIKIRNTISLNPKTYHIEFYSPLGEGNYVIDSDYNIFYPISGNQFQFIEVLDVTTTNFAGWQSFSKAGCTFDPNSLTLNPLFLNPANGDFQLQSNSPAIDNGTNVGLTKDYDGNPIPQGAGFDIGAFEYLSGFTLPGDLNNDGIVDISDLAIIAIHFGKRNTHPAWNATADVMMDYEIDVYDVVFVASRFT